MLLAFLNSLALVRSNSEWCDYTSLPSRIHKNVYFAEQNIGDLSKII